MRITHYNLYLLCFKRSSSFSGLFTLEKMPFVDQLTDLLTIKIYAKNSSEDMSFLQIKHNSILPCMSSSVMNLSISPSYK
jgi:hypothetical protein